MDINYSIIIPHRNIPKLLQRLLDSIPQRDDLQIIVVDDNSDPSKVDFDNFPGVGTPHVEVYFTKEGKGGGYARNVGLDHARGKWLLFADADDYFFTEQLSSLMEKYKETDDVEVVYLNAVSYNMGTTVKSDRQPRISKIISSDMFPEQKKADWIRFETWEPWTRMCRRDFVQSKAIRFDEIPRANDKSFGLKVSIFSTSYRIERDIYYCWEKNPKSITSNPIKKEIYEIFLILHHNINLLYKKNRINWRAYYFHSWIIPPCKKYGLSYFCNVTLPLLIKNKINPLEGIYYYTVNRKLYKFLRK